MVGCNSGNGTGASQRGENDSGGLETELNPVKSKVNLR